MTEGRRSSPVPQLKCVGGSCSSFTPQAVQCKNVGSDGVDAQWECKCEFPSDIRFGRISVSCEGYDYPNDPFILKGSCGLEYTIEKTGSSYSSHLKHGYDSSGGMGSGVFFIILLVGIAVFMCCLTRSSDPRDPNHRGNYHPHDGGSPPPPPSNPPPYGWKQPGGNQDTRFRGGYTSPPPSAPPPPTYEESTGQAGTSSGGQRGSNNDGPGFWSGMGLGAAAGYLFSRPRTHHRNTGWFGSSGSTHHHYHQQPHSSSSSWGFPSSSRGHTSSWGSSPGSSSSRSTTTRTSYGGTTRR